MEGTQKIENRTKAPEQGRDSSGLPIENTLDKQEDKHITNPNLNKDGKGQDSINTRVEGSQDDHHIAGKRGERDGNTSTGSSEVSPLHKLQWHRSPKTSRDHNLGLGSKTEDMDHDEDLPHREDILD